tara:strand:+ start:1792 stop:2109 length:318 start_codon:yes stop_codon:yes gene_type:complete
MGKNKTIISISKNDKKFNCGRVAELLKKCGIESDIMENMSIIKDKDKFHIERGCNIRLHNLNPQHINGEVWAPLEKEFGLDCAHLSINGVHNGCIHEYFYEMGQN